MGSKTRAWVLQLSRKPMIGRFVHIASAVNHLPRFREILSDLMERVAVLEARPGAENDVWNAQFPELLRAISMINHQQLQLEKMMEVLEAQLSDLRRQMNLSDVPLRNPESGHAEDGTGRESSSPEKILL